MHSLSSLCRSFHENEYHYKGPSFISAISQSFIHLVVFPLKMFLSLFSSEHYFCKHLLYLLFFVVFSIVTVPTETYTTEVNATPGMFTY